MPVNSIFGGTIDLLGKSLDLRAKRQGMIAANVANAETPNYAPSDLKFEEQLKGALKGGSKGQLTNPRHIPLRGGESPRLELVTGEVVDISSKAPGPDGNAVELESEMGRMAENQIMYNASIQLLTKKFEMMKQAIRGTI